MIEETAKEQSAAVGEADLRRMKRQFSSLKNTFLHYVVKDEFIAALADGLPNGTENVLLSQYDEDANRNIENLRALKARNGQTQEEISSLISHINAVLDDLNETNANTTSIVSQIRRDIEDSQNSAADIPELPPGLDESQCQAALTEEAEKARKLEAAIVEQTNKSSEIEAILPSEREETEVLSALVADLSSQREAFKDTEEAEQQQQQPFLDAQSTRFSGTVAWADNVIAILQALGGVKIISSLPGQQPSNPTTDLLVELSTSFPSIPVSNGSLGACTTGGHSLSMALHTLTGAVCSASLTPADIDISDIIEASISGSRGPDFVVRETRSRLAGVLHRRALANEAIAAYPGTMVDPSGVSITALVPISNRSVITGTNNSNNTADGERVITVQVVMDSSWPAESSDASKIVRMSSSTVMDNGLETMLGELNGKRFEGCGFIAALQAVEQRMASSR